MLKNQSDDELWNAVVEDNNRAFTTLYNRYWQKLYKTVFYYVKNKEVAEQTVHDTFVILWNRRKYLNIANFANYIHVTARYHVFKELKARKISPLAYIENYDTLETEKEYNGAEQRFQQQDFETELKSCIKPLPKRCKEIFWLSRIENLSNDEIAEKFGISKRTVENQITYALKHIRTVRIDTSCAFTLFTIFILYS
ncbi:RNA polymerase sigma factor [Pedobacter arcticus]|uniref:RNA polymerase sigma factor n=1 Tax=Pedobacter arcticus TaxID=752140 RepID=UPI00030C9E2C|nr:RNA polymerase sigma-70 factor [Pedobacter arcticus]